MSTIDGIAASLREALARTGGSLVVQDRDFGANLRLGEIIRGRVLRHYEGGRYLVQFGEHQKVVDSSIPLRVSERFAARVRAIGDRVDLQHLREEGKAAAAAIEPGSGEAAPRDELVSLLERWNAELDAEAVARVARLARGSAEPSLVRLASVVVSKLGLPASEELIAAIATRLADPSATGAGPGVTAIAIDVGGEKASSRPERTIEPIVALLESLSEGAADDPADPPAETNTTLADAQTNTHSNGHEGRSWQHWDLGHWLFNVQSHPRIAHRLLNAPLWIGDRLTELEIALFEQHGEPDAVDECALQRVVLRLDLEWLGRVQVRLTAAGRRLRLRVAADREAGSESLARHAAALRANLEDRGWLVDEMEHVLERRDAADAPLEAVVLHHITQDSLSRWM